jgi:hypothetical protein
MGAALPNAFYVAVGYRDMLASIQAQEWTSLEKFLQTYVVVSAHAIEIPTAQR